MAPLSRPGPPGQGAAETNARGLRRRGKFEFIRCKCWRSSLLFVLMGQLAAGFEGGRNTVALHRVLADHERRLRSRVSPKVANAILAVPGPAMPQGPAEATKPAAAAAKTEPLLQMVPADSTTPTEVAGNSAVPDASAAEQSRAAAADGALLWKASLEGPRRAGVDNDLARAGLYTALWKAYRMLEKTSAAP